jgi:hypothetical protein
VKFSLRNPFCVFGLVVLWRVALLVFTAQPIPANDAFFFDGAVVNWILHGHYFNPSLSAVFPISGHELYAAYPPLYQAVLLAWMKCFGTSVISAMALHVALFSVSGFITLLIVNKYFPAAAGYALAVLLFFGITFDDRPEGLAHAFGLAALLLLTGEISGSGKWKTTLAISFFLLAALYTSVIVGAFYFGTGFIAVAAAWLVRRKNSLFIPFIAAVVLFAAITFIIAKTEPLWWAGFRENARQTPVLTIGFRKPDILEILKLIRAAPVFLLALGSLPFVFARRKQIFAATEPWLFLVVGVFVMGWVLLAADMTLLSANYVGYVMFTQIILAAGLLALGEKHFSERRCWLRGLMLGCVILISVRAVGMTTWGAACAWKNSYPRTQETLRAQFAPFATNDAPVVVSSAYLYTALACNVKNPIHSDWFFDRADSTKDADLNGIIHLKPKKLVLMQYDYYRAFELLLERLRQQPELVEIHVRDQAAVRTPDSIPSMRRVLQHISWAPVIVDLEWKETTP